MSLTVSFGDEDLDALLTVTVNDTGDVAEHDTFIGSGSTYAITLHAFDAFGRTITTTNALGHAITIYERDGANPENNK